MNELLSKKQKANLAVPEWFEPRLYSEWMKGTTAGDLLIEIKCRVDFLRAISANIADFEGSSEIERNHFMQSISDYGLVKWASCSKRTELKVNSKAIYSPLKPVSIDDVLLAIKKIQAKNNSFTFSKNRAGETILHTAWMRNHPVDIHLSDEMWLKVDLRSLSSDNFALEAKLYSLFYSDRFASHNNTPFPGRDYTKLFTKLIQYSPLAYLDLVIWKVLNEGLFTKQNMINCYFAVLPKLSKEDPESFFNRTVSGLMEDTIGVDANGKVDDDKALKKLTAWLASWNTKVGCSFANMLLNEF